MVFSPRHYVWPLDFFVLFVEKNLFSPLPVELDATVQSQSELIGFQIVAPVSLFLLPGVWGGLCVTDEERKVL